MNYCFEGPKKPAELEVCYINEIAFDDDPIKEEEEEESSEHTNLESQIQEEIRPDPDTAEPGRFPRSKSDWEAFRNPTLLSLATPREESGKRYAVPRAFYHV